MPFRFNPFTDKLDLTETGALPPGGGIQTITGNSGGAVGPNLANNVNLLGSGTISVTGNPGTNTLTISQNGTVATTYTANSGSATPSAGNLNVLATVAAAGTTPFTSVGAGSTITYTVQRTQTAASTAANIAGIASFLNTQFSVDANGFVSLNGAGVGLTITGQSGGALSPTAGNWNIFGATIVAGTTPVVTSGSGSTLTTNVQLSQAIAATDVTKVGLANFNSAMFSVDANGFVALLGGGQAIDSVAVQTGTSPIVPTVAGLITINGATVAAGTNPVRTDGTGANTLAVEVQISQALASTDATKIGLCNFNSSQFSVDANGFVTLAGGGEAIDSIGVDATSGGGTNPVLPTAAGLVTVNGARVAAGTNPIRTVSTAANVYQVQVQTSQALAATDATKVGLANFDSASFSVDANGFVTMAGGGGFTWNDVSGAFSPLKNNGYFITGTATGTLPAAPAQGDTVKFFVDHASQVLTIQATAGKIIRFGSLVSSSGGTFVSTLQGDSVELTYRTADTCWCAIAGFTGTWTLT